MSISNTDSCGSPLRNDADSIPSPVTAPPSVIVFSCGTTSGDNPYGSVAATRSSYVHMPATSAGRAPGPAAPDGGPDRAGPGAAGPRARRPPPAPGAGGAAPGRGARRAPRSRPGG